MAQVCIISLPQGVFTNFFSGSHAVDVDGRSEGLG